METTIVHQSRTGGSSVIGNTKKKKNNAEAPRQTLTVRKGGSRTVQPKAASEKSESKGANP